MGGRTTRRQPDDAPLKEPRANLTEGSALVLKAVGRVDGLPIDPANSFAVYRWHEQTRGVLHQKTFTRLASARAWIAATRRTADYPRTPGYA